MNTSLDRIFQAQIPRQKVCIYIVILPDNEVEGNEEFTVSLISKHPFATIERDMATVTIVDVQTMTSLTPDVTTSLTPDITTMLTTPDSTTSLTPDVTTALTADVTASHTTSFT